VLKDVEKFVKATSHKNLAKYSTQASDQSVESRLNRATSLFE
jgi:hypothetical protein